MKTIKVKLVVSSEEDDMYEELGIKSKNEHIEEYDYIDCIIDLSKVEMYYIPNDAGGNYLNIVLNGRYNGILWDKDTKKEFEDYFKIKL